MPFPAASAGGAAALAWLSGAWLSGAWLSGAWLSGVSLSGAGRAGVAAGRVARGVGVVAGVARATVVGSGDGFCGGREAWVSAGLWAGLAAGTSRVPPGRAALADAGPAGTACAWRAAGGAACGRAAGASTRGRAVAAVLVGA